MSLTECDIFEVGSRKWKVCRNEAGLTPHKTNVYRVQWGLEPLLSEDVDPATTDQGVIPEFVFHGHSVGDESDIIRNKLYGPGTELLKIYEAAGVPSCDACKELAQDMNNWGVAGCRERLEETVADILPRAKAWLDQQHPWAMKLIPDALEEYAIAKRVRADVTRAIDECEKLIAERRSKKLNIYTGEKLKACSSCSGGKPYSEKPKNRNRRLGPFLPSQGEWRFITLEQYATDIRELLRRVPHDVDCVAGVARSGLYAATMVAMMLHKPMVVVSQTAGHITEAGNGWRLGGFKHVTPTMKKVLVVDDTVMTGGSQKRIREVVQKQFEHVTYATVYCNPFATLGKPDIHAVDLEWPHILEWNIFNSIISPSLAVDFDGILCRDCTREQDDDGERYRDFIQNAEPLYVPQKEPVPLIVTARIEKYRDITEEWLKRYGIRWQRLVMHPALTLEERNRDDIAAYKAKHFSEWANKNPHAPGPNMFCESDHRQAERIHKLSGLPTMCPASAKVWH